MNTTTRTPTRTRIALILAGLALVSTAAGCASGGAGTDSTATAAGGLGSKWGTCMRDAGFDVQDPRDEDVQNGVQTFRDGDASEPGFDDAAASCYQKLGIHGADKAQKEKWKRQYDQVASCIREEFPDFPEQEPGSVVADPEKYPRAAEPRFDERFTECAQKYAPDSQSAPAG